MTLDKNSLNEYLKSLDDMLKGKENDEQVKQLKATIKDVADNYEQMPPFELLLKLETIMTKAQGLDNAPKSELQKQIDEQALNMANAAINLFKLTKGL